VLAYLSRYTHRVAISNSRLLACDGAGVAFKYKDYRVDGHARQKVMRLATDEFTRRFLIHVLPTGFHRIRHYGLFASGILFAVTALHHPSRGLFQLELEGRKHLSRSHRIWNVILEAVVAAFGSDGDVGREHESLLLSATFCTNQKSKVISTCIRHMAAGRTDTLPLSQRFRQGEVVAAVCR
jgi:Putative transposase